MALTWDQKYFGMKSKVKRIPRHQKWISSDIGKYDNGLSPPTSSVRNSHFSLLGSHLTNCDKLNCSCSTGKRFPQHKWNFSPGISLRQHPCLFAPSLNLPKGPHSLTASISQPSALLVGWSASTFNAFVQRLIPSAINCKIEHVLGLLGLKQPVLNNHQSNSCDLNLISGTPPNPITAGSP